MHALIGIYTRPSDDHLGRVVAELDRRHLSWICFDTADFPHMLQLSARLGSEICGWHGKMHLSHTSIHLEQIHSIWYRRPTKKYQFPSDLSGDELEFATAEAQRGFVGLFYGLSTRWISHPDAIRAAEWKPKQLALAQRLGLRVPRTLITNDPQAALRFFEECAGEMIYKPFNQGVPQPRKGETWQGAIYTTKMTRPLLEAYASGIALTTCLFQEHIPKAFDLRITIIGTQIFAAEIHSQEHEQTQIDFRKGYEQLSYCVHRLPEAIGTACLAVVRAFDLQFAAIDMIVTPEHEYIFLEINPCGQWGWIEEHTSLPLTATLVDLLAQTPTQ